MLSNKMFSEPTLGYGTFGIKREVVADSVHNAIMQGYRLIDTAAAYQNEEEVGKGIALAIQNGINREEICLCTKIWVQDFGDNLTYRALERALKRMKTDYVDVCLLHYPYGDTYGAWRDLIKAKENDLVKNIGVSNFQRNHIADFCLHNDVKPFVNQIEINPWYQRSSEEKFLKEMGIFVEAWSPLAMGNKGIKNNYILRILSNKYSVTPQQIVLRWIYQRGISSVVKSSNVAHMRDNMNIFDFNLSETDMRLIALIDKDKSSVFGNTCCNDVENVVGTGSLLFETYIIKYPKLLK